VGHRGHGGRKEVTEFRKRKSGSDSMAPIKPYRNSSQPQISRMTRIFGSDGKLKTSLFLTLKNLTASCSLPPTRHVMRNAVQQLPGIRR